MPSMPAHDLNQRLKEVMMMSDMAVFISELADVTEGELGAPVYMLRCWQLLFCRPLFTVALSAFSHQ